MSDDNENFRSAQGKHADRIKFERELENATGLTREQVRRGLQGLYREHQAQVTVARVEPKITPREHSELFEETSQVFAPKPFRLTKAGIDAVPVNEFTLPPYPTDEGEYGLLLTVDGDGVGTLTWDQRIAC